jgi:3',5'-cyclic AMP phosphodiesterase CpdA
MSEVSVRVVHLTDIHFSEDDFWGGAYAKARLPHRHGHSPTALIALDEALHEIKYDLLILSGDLSRVGHEDSFGYVKTWLYGQLQKPGGGAIGLRLDPAEKRCFVVPGNHDCFNENLRQHSLTNYHKFFPDIKGNTIERTQANGINVNVHLYDSTYDRGGFAKGFIPPSNMQGWESDEKTLDLVVVHHHLAQLPEHKRDKALEMINVGDFMSFLLSRHINGVFFGHTHESFFEKISAELLRTHMKDQRRWERWLRKSFPRFFSGNQRSTLNYPKIATRNGRYSSLDKFFEYLYIKYVMNRTIKGPDSFDEPKQFHDYVRGFRSEYNAKFIEACKRKVAFSMAPSPTYHEADNKGFHVVDFKWDGSRFRYSCEHYEFDGGRFVLVRSFA